MLGQVTAYWNCACILIVLLTSSPGHGAAETDDVEPPRPFELHASMPPSPPSLSFMAEPVLAMSAADSVAGTSTQDVGSYQEVGGPAPAPGEHTYSGPSSSLRGPSSKKKQTSRSESRTLAPEMLDVQIQIRDAVAEMSNCLNTNLPRIAKSLEDMSQKYCDK